ncbi:MAG: ATP-dependent helicase, partial [Saprospiraceae bacterium]|nr:ATP-dependent helicase [Saprospiraceae bacterium]
INVDTPTEAESYIHRIGRTGRADREGAAITLVTEAEIPAQAAIEALMEQPIPLLPLPEEVAVSTELTQDERPVVAEKNYLKAVKFQSGAFHEKKAKNKKVNLGNDRKRIMAEKYKKPIKKGAKRK